MQNRKSGFFTFLCAFIPGGGEMYLGLMKKGCIIMTAFAGIMFFSALIRNGVFTVLLPVIWFYSFFDTLNLRHLEEEQKIQSEERFLQGIERIIGGNWKEHLSGKKNMLGYICIFFGLYTIFDNVVVPFFYRLDYVSPWIREVIYNIPSIVVAIVIVWFGLTLIQGKEEKQKKKEEDFVEYEGEKKQ